MGAQLVVVLERKRGRSRRNLSYASARFDLYVGPDDCNVPTVLGAKMGPARAWETFFVRCVCVKYFFLKYRIQVGVSETSLNLL